MIGQDRRDVKRQKNACILKNVCYNSANSLLRWLGEDKPFFIIPLIA